MANHGDRFRTVRRACTIGTAVLVVVLAAGVVRSAGAAESAAVRAQANAIQAARDAARAGERVHDAKAAADAAADRAAAAHTQKATQTAAHLAAVAAKAQLVYNRKAGRATRAQRALAKAGEQPVNPGANHRTTHKTTKQAQHEADEACAPAKHDADELEAAQKHLAHEQAKPHPNPAKIAELQATVDELSVTAAASAAACTTATATADAELASFRGFSRGVKHEGTPTVSENDPFPDNYEHSDNVELVGH